MGSWGRVLAARAGSAGGSGGTRWPRNLGEARAGRRWRRPGEGSQPASSGSTKTEASSCRRGLRPGSVRPGSLAQAHSGTQYPACGLRGFGPRVSLRGGGARRGQLSPRRQRGGGGGRTPGPLAAPPSSPPPRGAVQGRGSTRGEGPACPAEPLLRMTQWFLEKALLGFPE